MSRVALISCFIGVVALIVNYLLEEPESSLNCSMAGQIEGLMRTFQAQNKTAFILGYTGEIGKELVRAVVSSHIFAKVVLIGRRTVTYEDEIYKDVEQKVVDFDRLDEYADVFKNVDVGYCCLGTTRTKYGPEVFYRVDHDYVVNAARIAKQGGCSQFHLVSSQGADKNSSFLYQKTKGEVEEELKAMNFQSLLIYRPALLLCKREESRPMEVVFKFALKPITWAFPRFISVPTSTVARAMLSQTVTPNENPVEVVDNKAIHRLGVCERGDSA